MNVMSVQKLTLLDYPGHTACTLFVSGCNYACPYCHNAELQRPNFHGALDLTEVFEFLAHRRNVLDGVCITGGEPTLQEYLIPILTTIRSFGYHIKVDTNGTHPEVLMDLVKYNLVDYVAMDVKAPLHKYAKVAGTAEPNLNAIIQSIEFLKIAPIQYEFRTTVSHPLHQVEDFVDIGMLLQGAKALYIQNASLIYPRSIPCSETTLKRMLETVRKYVPNAQIRGEG